MKVHFSRGDMASDMSGLFNSNGLRRFLEGENDRTIDIFFLFRDRFSNIVT